jgi:hypothetical protein
LEKYPATRGDETAVLNRQADDAGNLSYPQCRPGDVKIAVSQSARFHGSPAAGLHPNPDGATTEWRDYRSTHGALRLVARLTVPALPFGLLRPQDEVIKKLLDSHHPIAI